MEYLCNNEQCHGQHPLSQCPFEGFEELIFFPGTPSVQEGHVQCPSTPTPGTTHLGCARAATRDHNEWECPQCLLLRWGGDMSAGQDPAMANPTPVPGTPLPLSIVNLCSPGEWRRDPHRVGRTRSRSRSPGRCSPTGERSTSGSERSNSRSSSVAPRGIADALGEHLHPRKPGVFRIQARYFFLTYAQCSLTPEQLVAGLDARGFAGYAAFREFHKDGNVHYHVLADYGSIRNIRSAGHFDIGAHHPNVAKVKTLGSCYDYCAKEGDRVGGTLVADPSWPRGRGGNGGGKRTRNDAFRDVIAAGTREGKH